MPRTAQSPRSHDDRRCARAPAGARCGSPASASERDVGLVLVGVAVPGQRVAAVVGHGQRAGVEQLAQVGQRERRPTTATAPRAAPARPARRCAGCRRWPSPAGWRRCCAGCAGSVDDHHAASSRRPARAAAAAGRRGEQVVHLSSYLTSRDSRRSASGLPPVWQPGQYWNDRSANDTSRTVSPHTGQGSPVRACTRRPERFSPLSVAAPWPTERVDGVGRAPSASRRSRSSTCSGFSRPADGVGRQLARCAGSRRCRRCRCRRSHVWSTIRVLIRSVCPREQLGELVARDSASASGPSRAIPGTCCGSATR